LIFEEGGKPENPEKIPRSKDENQQKTQPTYDAGSGNRTHDTLMGGESVSPLRHPFSPAMPLAHETIGNRNCRIYKRIN